MRSSHIVLWCLPLVVLGGFTPSVRALPLVSSLTENGTGLNANGAIATSASNPFPGAVGDPNTSAALGDESLAYVTRTHEWTAVRTLDTTGLLNNALTGTTLQPFPSYLLGLEYIQLANENRTVPDYSLDVTLTAPAKAYMFLDNRLNGTLNNNSSPNTDDPDLGGNLAWVVNDGWSRVNTGFMPNGQADYIGVDEGATVANAAARTHPATTGSGNGLNQFSAIYLKEFAAGAHIGFLKTNGITNINFFGVALAPSGPPPVLGDTDGDGTVEFEDDFGPIRDNFRKSGKSRAQGDLTGGGIVDFNDFREWKAAFVGAGGSLEGRDVSFTNIPEPASALLFMIAAAALAVGNRTRRHC